MAANPPGYYDNETLFALEEALRDVWQVLKVRAPYPNWDPDPELKKALAERLMALADSGVRDPHELSNRTLQSLLLGRPTEWPPNAADGSKQKPRRGGTGAPG
jgi:hypothetical protein